MVFSPQSRRKRPAKILQECQIRDTFHKMYYVNKKQEPLRLLPVKTTQSILLLAQARTHPMPKQLELLICSCVITPLPEVA
jgi:hypothetical protein